MINWLKKENQVVDENITVWDVLEEVNTYIEHTQLTAALDTIKDALKQEPHRKDYQSKLDEIKKLMDI